MKRSISKAAAPLAEATQQGGVAGYAAQTGFPTGFAVQGYGGVMQMMNVNVLEVGKSYIVNKGDGTGDQTLELTAIQKEPLKLTFGAVEVNNADHVLSEAKAVPAPVPVPAAAAVAVPSTVVASGSVGSGAGVSAAEDSAASSAVAVGDEDAKAGDVGQVKHMDACDCDNAPADLRGQLQIEVVEALIAQQVDKTAAISYTSIGAGGGLQDYQTVSQILGAGYSNVEIHLVDYGYGNIEGIEKRVAALQGKEPALYTRLLTPAKAAAKEADLRSRSVREIVADKFRGVPEHSQHVAVLAVEMALAKLYVEKIEEFSLLLKTHFPKAKIVIGTHADSREVLVAQRESHFATHIVVSVDTPGVEGDANANVLVKQAAASSDAQIMKTLNNGKIADWKGE